jgi:hypothetical protein
LLKEFNGAAPDCDQVDIDLRVIRSADQNRTATVAALLANFAVISHKKTSNKLVFY